MKSSEQIKELVKNKYSEIARQEKSVNLSSCCGSGPVSGEVYNIMTDDYSALEGYNAEADLGLGCGLPTQFAKIRQGDTVIDLGSGAGNDCFIARYETGPEGKVIGIDFSEDMIKQARINADKRDLNNVEFRYGDIEELPVADNTADVIVSNCVLNLVPDKEKVINEIFRVLKDGGHFSISDIVLQGELPPALISDAEMYAGCVSGAIQKDAYLQFLQDAGFEDIQIQKQKPIHLPDDILASYLNEKEIVEFRKSKEGIISITVFGKKPGESKVKQVVMEEKEGCCEPGSGCC